MYAGCWWTVLVSFFACSLFAGLRVAEKGGLIVTLV